MDLATLIGLTVGITGVLVSVTLEGGHLRSLAQLPAAVVVFGGTYGATIASCSLRSFFRSFSAFLRALTARLPDRRALIEQLVDLATRARREGLLALESQVQQLQHPVLRKALQLVVDGLDPEAVTEIMETELLERRNLARQDAEYYTTWGGLGPTLGVTGTVMGLVHMMEKIDDPANMGPAIATAFCATLYGVAAANLIFLPIGRKLALIAQEEFAVGQMIVAGVSSIQEGASPLSVRERLNAYLAEGRRSTGAESSPELKAAA